MSAQLIENQTWMKCVIVGNQEVGKTCIYSAFALNFFPQGTNAYQSGDYAVNMMIEGNTICLGLWDTVSKLFFLENNLHGPATKFYLSVDFQGVLNNLDLDKLLSKKEDGKIPLKFRNLKDKNELFYLDDDDDEDRKQNYECTDVLLLAFSLVDPESFSNIVSKWNPEVVQYCPGVPKILVGTKMDLRDDKNTVSKLKERGYAPICNPQGRQVMADIGAIDYVECSGISMEGIDDLFHNCVISVLSKELKRTTKKKWRF